MVRKREETREAVQDAATDLDESAAVRHKGLDLPAAAAQQLARPLLAVSQVQLVRGRRAVRRPRLAHPRQRKGGRPGRTPARVLPRHPRRRQHARPSRRAAPRLQARQRLGRRKAVVETRHVLKGVKQPLRGQRAQGGQRPLLACRQQLGALAHHHVKTVELRKVRHRRHPHPHAARPPIRLGLPLKGLHPHLLLLRQHQANRKLHPRFRKKLFSERAQRRRKHSGGAHCTSPQNLLSFLFRGQFFTKCRVEGTDAQKARIWAAPWAKVG